jgi:hypothetical protein
VVPAKLLQRPLTTDRLSRCQSTVLESGCSGRHLWLWRHCVGCWWLIVDDADNDEAASAAAFVAHDVGLVVPHDGGAAIVACGTAMCHWLLFVVGRNSAVAASDSDSSACDSCGRSHYRCHGPSFVWRLGAARAASLSLGRRPWSRTIRCVPFNAASCVAARSPHTSSSVGCKSRD